MRVGYYSQLRSCRVAWFSVVSRNDETRSEHERDDVVSPQAQAVGRGGCARLETNTIPSRNPLRPKSLNSPLKNTELL